VPVRRQSEGGDAGGREAVAHGVEDGEVQDAVVVMA